jgi:hypothetical protein
LTFSTKSVAAAHAYLFSQDDEVRKEQLSHLTGICYKACGGLFIPSEFQELKSTGGTRSNPDDPDGARIPLLPEKDDTQHTRLREFCQEFVLDTLAPFSVQIDEPKFSANENTFRFIGRSCRFALLKEIRDCAYCGKRKVKCCAECGQPITGARCCDTKENPKTRCPDACPSPGVRTSLDVSQEEGSNLGEMVVGVPLREPTSTRYILPGEQEPEPLHTRTLKRWIERHQSFLRLHKLLYGVVLLNIALEQGLTPGEVTTLWRRTHGIAERTAELRKEQFFATVNELKDHPIIVELLSFLEPFGKPASHGIRDTAIAVAESPTTKAARLAKAEAGRLLAEFRHETGITDFADENEESRLSAERDEIDALRRTVTLVLSPFRQAEREELADALKAELDPEDLQYLEDSKQSIGDDLGVSAFEDNLVRLEDERLRNCGDDESLEDITADPLSLGFDSYQIELQDDELG